MVASAGSFTTREQLRERVLDQTQFVRETRSLGATGEPLRWRDARDDLLRRAALWRSALEAGGIRSGARVLLRLPTHWAIGADCLLALADMPIVWMSADELAAALELTPDVLITTPTDALAIARALDPECSPIKTVFVTGEPGGSVRSTRRAIEERFGARCFDVYALTEFGVVGWSCASESGGLHLDEDAFDVESASSELIVSTREPRSVRIARYCTGDLVHLSRSGCACGSSWVRADGGILGRVNEKLEVRGTTLVPSQIEDVVRRHPAVRDFTLLAYRAGEVAVRIEPEAAIASEGDRARVAAEVSEDLKRSLGVRLQCDVVPADSGSVPQDSARRARRALRLPSERGSGVGRRGSGG